MYGTNEAVENYLECFVQLPPNTRKELFHLNIHLNFLNELTICVKRYRQLNIVVTTCCCYKKSKTAPKEAEKGEEVKQNRIEGKEENDKKEQ